MKTLLEIKNEWVKTQVGYGFDKDDGQFSNWNEWWAHRTISEQDLDEISKMYASQFIDAAAENVEIEYTPYENGNDKDWEDFTSTSGEWFRVDKQTILKLKDQLK